MCNNVRNILINVSGARNKNLIKFGAGFLRVIQKPTGFLVCAQESKLWTECGFTSLCSVT